MTSTALKLDDPLADFADAQSDAGPARNPVAESLFENFVDEIDAWARQALAANGFGDYV